MFRQTLDMQMTLDDRMLTANAQTKKAVDTSRAKLVGDIIYPNIDEAKFKDLYSETGSRPNIEIRRYVSMLVLKRMYGLSDEVFLEFLRCGALNFQYALQPRRKKTSRCLGVPSAVSAERSKPIMRKITVTSSRRSSSAFPRPWHLTWACSMPIPARTVIRQPR